MKEVQISAENKKGAKIKDFETDAENGEFPGGEGKFIEIGNGEYKLENPISKWCILTITNDKVIIRDGIANNPISRVNRQMTARYKNYLQEKGGGEVKDEITYIEAK